MRRQSELDESLALLRQQEILLSKALYCASFKEFVLAAWPHISRKKLIWGWHLDVICEMLEKVSRREIIRLIVNVPPRSLKSMLISVLYPVWVWINRPHEQFLTCSHSKVLATRDARYARNLIMTPWFRDHFPNVALVFDQNQKMYYETTQGGHRQAVAIKEGLTGKGGDHAIIDDPHDATKTIMSDNEREHVISVYEESIEQRLNEPGSDPIIVVMQRLHENDLTGWLLKNRAHEKWVHLCFPLEYEPDHPHLCIYDRRKKRGEILLPGRWAPMFIKTQKGKPLVWAGQMQQRPSARGGMILLRKSWNVWTEPDMPEIRYVIMSLDTAFKPGQENDYSACTVWGLFNRQMVDKISKKEMFDMILMHAWRGKFRYPELRERITLELERWRKMELEPNVILIEDRASGQSLIQELDASGVHGVVPWPPKNRGVSANEPPLFRAHLAAEILDDGAIWVPGKRLPDGTRDPQILIPWADTVVSECEVFPRGENDDYVTTCVQAWRYVRVIGMIESSADVDETDGMPVSQGNPSEPIYG